MKKIIQGIEEIKKILPACWEKQAHELGAISRSRVIKNAEELLILNLLYQTSGKSLGGTSSILKSSGELGMSKQAFPLTLISPFTKPVNGVNFSCSLISLLLLSLISCTFQRLFLPCTISLSGAPILRACLKSLKRGGL